jgi:acetylglutamate synthase
MKTKQISIIFLSGALVFCTFSCSSSKKAAKPSAGMEEVTVPLSGKDYQSTKDLFRAKSVGKSPDMATAKKIALNNAKAEIAGLIQTTIKSVTDNYTNQRSTTDAQDFENKFENIAREVVLQQLNDISIIGEKVFKDKSGTVEYYLAIEISKESVINGITSKVGQDKKLQIDYDKKKFEEIMNAEMEKMENGK